MASEHQTLGASAEPRPLAPFHIVPVPALSDADRVVLADLERRKVHELNPTAAAVWASCDGRTTIPGITAALAAHFGPEPDEILGQVDAAVRQLAAIGLVDLAPDGAGADPFGARTRAGREGRYLRFAPCGCGPDLSAQPWDALLAVDCGDLRLGVRCGSPEITAEARSALDARIVDDPDVEPNLSLAIDARTPSWLLYENDRLLDRFPPEAAVRWLRARLGAWDPLPTGALRLDAVALVSSRAAVLVPRWTTTPTLLESTAADAGLDVEPAPVTLAAPDLGLDGRLVRAIVVPGTSTAKLQGVDALREILHLEVLRGDEDGDDVADQLARVAERATVMTARPDDTGAVAAALLRAG